MTLRRRRWMLAGCLAFAACREATPEETLTNAVVAVTVDVARLGSIREVIAATGLVTSRPGGELLVTAPEAARIAELPGAEGDRVRAGDLLVRFDIPTLSAGAASSRAGVEQAAARAENAQAASARVNGLFNRGVAARREVEEADREVRESQAALDQARSARGAASDLASRLVVRARFAGVIAKRWHNPGDLVEPGPSDPILRVIDPTHLEVVAAVPVGSLDRIIAGAPARIIHDGGQPIEASVVSRPAAIEPGSVTASVRLRPASAEALTAGTSVVVEIMGRERTGAVLVPSAAVLREGAASVVMTMGADTKAHRNTVEVGIVSPSQVEIVSGIRAGDKVIVRGQSGLPEGAAVTAGS